MTSCIYYDLEEISPNDVQLARAAAPGAVEFVARGTVWPRSIGRDNPETVPSSRNFDYQTELMDWIDRLFDILDRGTAGGSFRGSCGVSLLETIRYRFLFEFADIEQRWRALNNVLRTGAERIIWVAPNNRVRSLSGLSKSGVPATIELLAVARRGEPSPSWRSRVRSLARGSLDRVLAAIARIPRLASTQRLTTGKSVVFVEYYPNSAKALVPVATVLKEGFGIDVVWIAARRPVQKLLEQLGVQSLALRQLSPAAHRMPIHFQGAARSRLREMLNDLPDELFRGTGHAVGKHYLLPAIHDQLIAFLEEAAYWVDALSEAFDALRPQCVVSTTYSSIIGRAAALVGRARTMRAAYVQHGIFPDRSFYTRFCNDALLLWGQANRRTLLRNGIAEEQISVVGATVYDELARKGRRQGPIRIPRLGEPIRVAYLASRTAGLAVSYSNAKHCLVSVAEAISQVPNGRLTVKLHPSDKTGLADSLLERFPGVELIREGSSQDVICASDVVIVVSSTTGLEACIADKPLIVLHTEGVPDCGPYQEYGAAVQVSLDSSEPARSLADEIKSLVVDAAKSAALAEGRRHLIDDLLNGGAGDATDLTAQAIADLTMGRSREARQLNSTQ